MLFDLFSLMATVAPSGNCFLSHFFLNYFTFLHYKPQISSSFLLLFNSSPLGHHCPFSHTIKSVPLFYSNSVSFHSLFPSIHISFPVQHILLFLFLLISPLIHFFSGQVPYLILFSTSSLIYFPPLSLAFTQLPLYLFSSSFLLLFLLM